MSFKVTIPPYGSRQNWVPRRAEVKHLIHLTSNLSNTQSKTYATLGFRGFRSLSGNPSCSISTGHGKV